RAERVLMQLFDIARRIEPREPRGDLGEGFAARLGDPLWLLARQWQLGEHQGENASSPVTISYRVASAPIQPPDDRPGTPATIVPCGGGRLEVRRHDGTEIDWWSADAAGTVTLAPAAPVVTTPTRFQYPGAPLPRWWQIEDHAVDIGGYPPDRGHLATLFL